jgi:hypothetical protein
MSNSLQGHRRELFLPLTTWRENGPACRHDHTRIAWTHQFLNLFFTIYRIFMFRNEHVPSMMIGRRPIASGSES